MLASYLPLFMMLAVAAALALTFFGLTSIFGPRNPSKEKSLPYESGSESVGAKHVRLSVKFYLTAILFVVFDIEAVFLYPWAVNFKALGWFGYIEMAVFAATLVVGLAYIWKKGALDWES